MIHAKQYFVFDLRFLLASSPVLSALISALTHICVCKSITRGVLGQGHVDASTENITEYTDLLHPVRKATASQITSITICGWRLKIKLG